MHIFDTTSLTHLNVPAQTFADKVMVAQAGGAAAGAGSLAGRFFILRKDELQTLHDYFHFDTSTLNDTEVIDEAVRFTDYKDYDFISLLYVCAPGTHANGSARASDEGFPELNFYVSPDHVVLCLPAKPGPALETAAASIIARLDALITKGEEHVSWLNRLLYVTLDILIATQASYLETLEDDVEDMLDEVTALKKPTDEMFQRIRAVRKTVYATMKAMRATGAVSDALITNESGYIQNEDMHLFRSIATRASSLTSLSTSIYALTDGLLRTYEAKISDRTNDAVTRLTSVTILMGVWTLVAGVYGMNFSYMPELSFHYAYFICLAALIIITIVLAVIFRRRKLL
jgi:magnesium transporter